MKFLITDCKSWMVVWGKESLYILFFILHSPFDISHEGEFSPNLIEKGILRGGGGGGGGEGLCICSCDLIKDLMAMWFDYDCIKISSSFCYESFVSFWSFLDKAKFICGSVAVFTGL